MTVEPGRQPVCSVMSCTTWGFSCPLGYPRGGELLPRLFTLTRICRSKTGRSIFCDTIRRSRFSTETSPIFTGHVVLWCSDFPLNFSKKIQRSSPSRSAGRV